MRAYSRVNWRGPAFVFHFFRFGYASHGKGRNYQSEDVDLPIYLQVDELPQRGLKSAPPCFLRQSFCQCLNPVDQMVRHEVLLGFTADGHLIDPISMEMGVGLLEG